MKRTRHSPEQSIGKLTEGVRSAKAIFHLDSAAATLAA